MSWSVLVSLLELLLATALCSGQVVVRTSNYTANIGERVELTCSVTVEGYVNHTLSITVAKAEGQPSAILDGSGSSGATVREGVTSYNETLTLAVNSFSDEGQYWCRSVVTDGSSGNQVDEMTAPFYLSILTDAVVTVVPNMVVVSPGSDVEMVCATLLEEGTLEWRKGQEVVMFPPNSRIMQTSTGIRISNATYADISTYTCAVVLNATVIGEATAALNISDYRPPYREGTVGIGLVKVEVNSDEPFVECPVSGRPGPSLFLWLGPSMESIPRELNESAPGPVVDGRGRLNVEAASAEDSGLYTCIGVDVTGANASQTLNIRIDDAEVFFLWTQWYMILVYCVVGVAILVLMVLSIWLCYATRKAWWVPTAKRIRVKRKYKKPQRRVPLDMNDFAKEVYERNKK